MKHLVGTLVRYQSGGEFFPYIADKWIVEGAGKSWKFQIKKNLKCQDGTEITPKLFKKSFEKIIPIYKANSSLPYLDSLVGIELSKKIGDEIQGIEFTDSELIFNFTEPVLSGFLEYLSMPYYGYYAESNFNSNGWIDNTKIISSGPYQIASYDINSTGVSELSIRKEWALLKNPMESAQRVDFHWSHSYLKEIDKKTTIVQTLDGSFKGSDGYSKILGAPDILYSVILDINEKSPFKELNLRNEFKKLLRNIQRYEKFEAENSTLTQTLFMDQAPPVIDLNVEKDKITNNSIDQIEVLSIKSDSYEVVYIEKIVTEVLNKMNIPFIFRRIGEDPNLKTKDKASRTKFSIRIASVFSGATFDAWVTDMMFCSDLGISFPDPSKDVCKALKSNLSANASKTKKQISDLVADAISKDASVLPILNIRNAFYFSNDLDLENVAADSIVLSFEDQRLK